METFSSRVCIAEIKAFGRLLKFFGCNIDSYSIGIFIQTIYNAIFIHRFWSLGVAADAAGGYCKSYHQ
jgi:hypothetical protein